MPGRAGASAQHDSERPWACPFESHRCNSDVLDKSALYSASTYGQQRCKEVLDSERNQVLDDSTVEITEYYGISAALLDATSSFTTATTASSGGFLTAFTPVLHLLRLLLRVRFIC